MLADAIFELVEAFVVLAAPMFELLVEDWAAVLAAPGLEPVEDLERVVLAAPTFVLVEE